MTNAGDLWQLEDVVLGRAARPRFCVERLTIPSGVVAVLGESGAGKTSLLNLLVGFETPDSGTVRRHSMMDSSLPAVRMRGGRAPLAWAPVDGLWPSLSVGEHVASVMPLGTAAHADDWLRRFDLLEVSSQKPATLSLGERSRLAAARALASEAGVQVMDEPLSHVDPHALPRYWNELRAALKESDSSLIFATHSAETVLREAGRVVCVSAGRVLFESDVETLYRAPPSPRVAAFLGPHNWFTPEDSRRWLNRPAAEAECVRPERLRIEADDDGPFLVEESRFAGSYAEARLRCENTDATRTFFHRPAGGALAARQRVRLQLWTLLLMGCLLTGLTGCRESAGSSRRLAVSAERVSTLPAEGPLLPAPRGLTFSPEGELFVLDKAGRMLVYGPDGRLDRHWWMPEYAAGRPEGAWVLLDGRIAVADTHYHRVLLFDRAGNCLDSFGSQGQEPGEFIYPVAVTQDPHGYLYVAEYGGHDRVQKFTADGEFVCSLGAAGTAPGEFQRASGVAWLDHVVYVADAINNRVQAFRDDGVFLGIVADAHSCGLHYPYDVAAGPDGMLYVVEYGAGRVTRLSPRGEVLGRYGRQGRGAGEFWTPWGIAVSRAGIVAVADTGNRRIVELSP